MIGGLGVGEGRSKCTVNALYETDFILNRERFSGWYWSVFFFSYYYWLNCAEKSCTERSVFTLYHSNGSTMQYRNFSASHWTFLSVISISSHETSMRFLSVWEKFRDALNKLELRIYVTDTLTISRVFLCKIYSYIRDSYLLLWFVFEVQKPVNYLACIITIDPLLQYWVCKTNYGISCL